MLRFPPGLRDRIKASAEQNGRSMNTEIIRVLEEKYPAPWSLAARVTFLIDLLGAIRKVRGYEPAIDVLTANVLETVQGIADGRVPELDEETRRAVQSSLNEWLEQRAEDEEERSHWYEIDSEGKPE